MENNNLLRDVLWLTNRFTPSPARITVWLPASPFGYPHHLLTAHIPVRYLRLYRHEFSTVLHRLQLQ
jgi:hypothetical protein